LKGSSPPMHDNMSVRVVSVTDELDWLAGWGMVPSRLAIMHVTRELAKVPVQMPDSSAADMVARFIDRATRTMEGREFLERRYDANTLRRAVRIQLKIEHTGKNMPQRHSEIMKALGLYYTEPAWRKNPRCRRALLGLLAEHIVSTNDQTSR
jgi:hypothetical protein